MIISFSNIGAWHRLTNGENQDALFSAESEDHIVIALADGVSTCSEAKKGAEIACSAIADLFLRKADYFMSFDSEKIAEFAISHILYKLRQQAEADSKPVEEYSSTVAAVLFDKKSKRLLFLNVGDGIIIATSRDKIGVIAASSDSTSGCCVTTTDGAQAMAKAGVLDAEQIDSVILCSDGAWRNMYSGTRLTPDAQEMLIKQQFGELGEYLKTQNCEDDHSFISMEIQNNSKRTTA